MNWFGRMFAVAVAITICVAPSVNAQEYAQAPTAEDQTAAQPEGQAPQQYNVPEKQQGMSVVGGTPVNNTGNLTILGLWVGNMAFKVGQDGAGKLYTVAPNGDRKRLPDGTDANNVAVPENSPLIQGLLKRGDAPRVIDEVKDKSGKIIQPQMKLGETGLLTPKVIGTRTMIVNGKPMVMGGAIVSELPDWRERLQARAREQMFQTARARQQQNAVAPIQQQASEHSFARVVPQKRLIAIKKKRKTVIKRTSR